MKTFSKWCELQEFAGQAPGITGTLGQQSYSGNALRGQSRFDQALQQANVTPVKAAGLLARNLQSILANDPKAEMKKKRIVTLLYQQVVNGNVQVAPEDQEA